jgi:hypothetical protein
MSSGLEHLYQLNENRSRRVSSWDARGMNRDYVLLEPGQEAVLADIQGAEGSTTLCILIDPTCFPTARWCCACADGETSPSVRVASGDFSHGLPRRCVLLVTVNPEQRLWCPSSFGLNSYFPMPFSGGHALEYLAYADGENYPLMFWYHHLRGRLAGAGPVSRPVAPGPAPVQPTRQRKRASGTKVNLTARKTAGS